MNAPDFKSPFERLAAINVNDHVEKKQNLSYLSWAWAVAELMKADYSANWVIHDPITYPDGTMMVSCTVTAFGKPVYMWLPVMNHRNQAIQNPNAFDINKNLMRCLVKAIACHGLGLYIYAGEDLPEPEKSEEQEKTVQLKSAKPVTKQEFDALPEEEQQFLRDLAIEVIANTDEKAMFQAYQAAKKSLDADEQVAFWSLFDSKQRSAIKRIGDTLKGMAA